MTLSIDKKRNSLQRPRKGFSSPSEAVSTESARVCIVCNDGDEMHLKSLRKDAGLYTGG